jgi:general secretion pathway protein C
VINSLDWLKKKPQSQSFRRAAPYVVLVIIAMMGADLTGLNFRLSMLPKTAPPGQKPSQEFAPFRPRGDYNDILARNIFNSDGIIPDIQTDGTQVADTSGPARETTLPLTLVGTIVHANPGKSVATLQIKGATEKILPYIPNDDIEGLATLIKVDRKKIFIRNLSSGGLEYVQIKDDSTLSFSKKSPGVTLDGPVIKEAPDTFAISRNDLETQMNNLPELLTQARAIPNMVGGRVDGFKVVEIQDDSLFHKFGIVQNDVIMSVDGDNLDSPAKAMELYNALKNKQQVQITVNRGGKPLTMTYNIR